MLHQQAQTGAHLPLLDIKPVGGEPIMSCDAWPVRRHTYGYLSSCKASPHIGRYQIILLGDRGLGVLTTCPGLHSTVGRLCSEPHVMDERN